jgi:MFS family permease
MPELGRALASRAAITSINGSHLALLLSTFVNNVGTGLYVTGAALYFTEVVRLSAAQVGIGFGASALVGIFISLPAGWIADRGNPRSIYVGSLLVGAVGMVLFLIGHTFDEFIIISLLAGGTSGVNRAIRPVLIRAIAGAQLPALRNSMLAVTNLGIGVGVVAAGFAVQADSIIAFRLLLAGNALSFVLTALICLRLPKASGAWAPPTRMNLSVIRDRAFAAVTALNAIFSVQFSILTFALPLWIVEHTHAPRWTLTASLLINTFLVAALQLPIGKRVHSLRGASVSFVLTGCAAFVGFILVGLSVRVSTIAALLVILVGVVALSFAEMFQSAAGLELSYALSPANRQGEYAGMFMLGQSGVQALAPYLLALVCLNDGQAGWIELALGYLVLAITAPVVLTAVGRTAQPADQPTTAQ